MNNNCIYQKLLLIKTLLGSYLLKGVLVSIYYRNSLGATWNFIDFPIIMKYFS